MDTPRQSTGRNPGNGARRWVIAAVAIALGADTGPVRAGEPPGSIGAVVDTMIREQRQDAIDGELGPVPYVSPEEWELLEVRHTRITTARRMGESVHAALVPLAVLATLFGVDSAGDLFLTLFPLGKAAALVKKIRKARRQHKARRGLMKQLAGSLERTEEQFVRAAKNLHAKELEALAGIHKHVKNPETITKLAVRAGNQEVDLQWMRLMLARRKLSGEMVENFTHYAAHPSWAALRGVLDNSLHGNSRDSLMSKLIGFLGEEAADRYARSKGFQDRYSRGYGAFRLRRGEEKLDLVGWTENRKIAVFAEVKNWRADLWQSRAKRNEILKQLEAHNDRAKRIIQRSKDFPAHVDKLLVVNARGYNKLGGDERRRFSARLDRIGWRVEVMPSSWTETADQFIDRLRKEP